MTDGKFKERQRVKPNEFVIRACPLPVGYWSEASPQLVDILKVRMNKQYSILCTAVLSQTLLYLQEQYDTSLTAEQLQDECDKAKQELTSGGSLSTQQRPIGVLQTGGETRKTAGKPHCLPLPTELLLEVFQSLDSIERIRCRRVCHVWNSILTTKAYFPDVRVFGQAGYYEDFSWDGTYWMLACLFKCLTNATKMVVISDLDRGGFLHVPTPIKRVFNERRQIPLVVMYECELDEECEGVPYLIGCLARKVWECSCARMIWSGGCIYYDRRTVLVEQHTFTVRSRADAEVQMWDLFENLQAAEKSFDVKALAEWIADCLVHQRSREIDNVLWRLNEYQSPDPRPTSQYRGVKWTVSNISDLDVKKLSMLTVAFLSECIKPNRIVADKCELTAAPSSR
ncbi:uncharacterized protein LOC129600243 isoform X3 [Paramacrobiotus metropolitanus]|nr:uncharacterized protein LOC129600243 isoform X3 [Paramacrobiotus metropolitanus]XP_055354681.1 uncharacterized protein LOC129600243 isoform X3 [Paramacrobiotus metropolitanus]